MTENANGSWRKPTNILLSLVLLSRSTSSVQAVPMNSVKPQVAQAHYESPEQHYTTQLINYSYSKKNYKTLNGEIFFAH